MNRSFWAGHILQFDAKPSPTYETTVGNRLLILVFIMEVILGPRLALAGWLGLPVPEAATRVPVLLLIALMLIRGFATINFSQLGLYSWKYWSATERWYFIQTFVLANGIFAMIHFSKLARIFTHPALWTTAIPVLVVHLIWGFYQELIYRGVLQTELVRRWGAFAGILVSNSLFTFGPLHFYHFNEIAASPLQAWIFAAIFAIGLFFGILFQRSGNLWIVGVLHGVGDWYITGLQQVATN